MNIYIKYWRIILGFVILIMIFIINKCQLLHTFFKSQKKVLEIVIFNLILCGTSSVFHW